LDPGCDGGDGVEMTLKCRISGDDERVAEDFVDEEISLGAYSIDLDPYPNEPGKPALVNVTWDQAAARCSERGQRLCTELEWEYACKGPKSTTYPWGAGYSATTCTGRADALIGKRPECKTAHGVMDIEGLALEWTASDWERGTPTGDKVVHVKTDPFKTDPKTLDGMTVPVLLRIAR
jgi:hypothetical protein